MSILGVLATLSLLAGSVIAQISAASCTFSSVYSWAFNSLNQSPCTIAAYLESTCNGGSFTIGPLLSGQEYLGPGVADGADVCKCNTVVYSLISACGACQSATWIDWPQWAQNCSTVLSPGSFPNPVPQGTRVPQWALADVTREDLALWDSLKAMAIGDGPEIGPGALIGTNASTSGAGSGPTGTNAATATNFPGLTTAFPTGTSAPKSGNSPTSGSSKKSSHTAAIVGGAIGGAAVIAIAVVTIGLLSRRKRSTLPPGPYMADVASQPLYDSQKPMSEVGTTAPSSTVETPVVPMKVYDPNDATTFPGYQEPQHVPDLPSQPPFQPYNAQHTPDMPGQPPFQPYNAPGNPMAPGNTMGNVQPIMPHGYSGLPTV